jgi:ribonuclease E
LVIDQTEALVAIDVNSGSFRTEEDAEETAFQMNLIAAKEIARQIRLRDLGGVIVNDFIDMKKEAHRRVLERTLRDAVRRDRARTKILRTSPFGLIEMTRQRIRPSLKRSVFQECPCCHGGGVVKSPESMSLEVFRAVLLASQQSNIVKIKVTLADDVVEYLNNKKRLELATLERDGNVEIVVRAQADAWPEHLEIECFDANNRPVPFSLLENEKRSA